MGKSRFIREFIGNIGWYIYVIARWDRNVHIQNILKDTSAGCVRDNLGVYLRDGYPELIGEDMN